jgi:hypothetical protein
MATTSQIVDEFVIQTRIDDQSAAGAETATKSVNQIEAAAKKAAASLGMLGGAGTTAGEAIGAAASSFQQVAGRVDDVTRAYNKLKSAQDTLATAQNAANREIAAGRADMDQVSRTLAELASRVETAAEKLGEARAEATANAEATAAWNGVLTQGAQAMGTFATGVAAQTQAMREEENAARAAAAAQVDLNRILNINVDGKGWKDAATYAQQVAEGTDRLRASISPAFQALQTLDAALAKVANAEKIGAGTTEEWAAARVRANETYAKTMSLIDGTAQKQQQAAAQDAAAAAAATAAFAAIERLQEKWDGEATAVKKSVEAQAEINGLLGAGLISAATAAKAIDGVTEAYRKMAAAAEAAATAQREAVAAQGQSAANTFAGVKPQNIRQDDADYAARASDIEAYFAALDEMRARLVPLAAASQEYTRRTEEAAFAERAGVISLDEGTAARERALASYRAVGAAAEQAATAQREAVAAQGQSIANTFAGVKPQNIQQDDANYAARAADIEAYGRALDDARAKIDPLFAALKRYEAELENIDAAVKTGAADEGVAAAARARATASYGQTVQDLQKTDSTVNQLGTSSRNTNTQMRLMGVQAIQTFSGLATGQPVMTTLIQQLHQVFDSLLATGAGFSVFKEIGAKVWGAVTSPIGLFVTGVGGAAAALTAFGVMAEHESTRLGDLRQQLRATHDDYLSLATATDAAAKQVAASTSLTTAQSRVATQNISSAKYFSGTQQDIVELTKASQDLARVWKIDVGAASKFLASAIDDPAKAAKEMAEKGFPGMSAALADAVAHMQRGTEAGKAFATVFSVIHQGTTGAVDDQSQLSKALKQLSDTFTVAKEGGKSLGQSIGELVDNFLALQVRGLSNLIQTLDKYITKMERAIALKNQGNTATQTGGGGVDDFGRLIPNTPTSSNNTSSSASASGSLAQVAEVIRPLVESAAKQYNVDVELLSRLQLAENRRPNADGTFRTSSAGAIGPMQVEPDTFAGMQRLPYGREFQGQSLSNNATNVNAGTDYFAYLLDRYKDKGGPYMAVLAYHDGETRIDNMLNGKLDSHGFSINASVAAYQEADKVTGGPVAAGGYAGSGLTGPYRYGTQPPTIGPGGYDFISNATTPNAAMLNPSAGAGDIRRTLDEAQELIKTYDLLSLGRKKLEEDRDKFQAALAIPGQTPEQYKVLNEALNRTKGALNDALSPAEQYRRSLQDQLPAAQAASEGAAKLAGVQQRLNELERSQPGTVTPEFRAKAIADALNLQSAAYQTQVRDIERSVAAEQKVTAAYSDGYAAVGQATASTQAYIAAIKLFPPGSEQARAAAAGLTEEFKRQAQAAADLKTAQQNSQLRDNLTYIKAETSSLGENENARTKQLAVLKATQDQLREHNGVLTEEAQKYIALTGTIADATAAFQLQQNSLNEVKSFFSNTFDTIANSITQAFATGNLAALKFKDIAKSVASAVISEFAKLAIINPLKNLLTGGNDPTLSSVGGILGKLFGGGVAPTPVTAVASLVAPTNAALALMGNGVNGPATPASVAAQQGLAGTAAAGVGGIGITQGAGILSGIDKLFGTSITKWLGSGESGAGAGIVATIGDKIVTGITNALGPGVTEAATEIAANVAVKAAAGVGAAYPLGAGAVEGVGSLARLAAGVSLSLGSTTETATAVATAAQTVSDALPYIGAAISVVTNLISGNYRGAGLVAGGGAIGAGIGGIIGGPPGAAIGAGIGALAGSVADLLFPAHPLHPFDATAVNVQNGQLAVGKTATQAEAANSLGQVQDFVTGINTFMSKAHIILENGNGQLGAIGQGIAGMVGLVTDPNKLLAELRFRNDPSDTSQFGVAKDALRGMSFPNGQALQDELIKIASFADATAAIGVRLKAVGQDLTNIQIANVEGANPSGTGTATGPNGESIQYRNDLRTALNNDLPQQTFANTQALDAEIDKVNQFVNGTVPGLLHPVSQTTSAIVEEAHKLERAYQDAIDQSLKYGLDNTKVLQDAAVEALKIVRQSGIRQIGDSTVQLADRLAVASGGGQAALDKQALDNFDIQAQKQRDDFSKLLTDTYGDEVKTWSGYAENMALLEATLGAERLQVVKQTAGGIVATNGAVAASYQNLFDLVASYAARIKSATGDQQGADLDNFDMKAAQERVAFIKEFTDAFGQTILADETFQAQLATVDATHYAERLQLHQKYVDQAMAQQKALDDVVTSIDARGLAASGDQRGADLLGFDMKARQEVDAFNQQFKEHYGEAYAATADYQQNITKLEEVQGQERLNIIKKYAEAGTSEITAALKSAQTNVAGLFTSLNDYVTRLKNSDQSPLSPTARYDLASSQFNAVAGAAAAGDAKSAGQLTGYSDALLTASRSVYGSGQQYAADFNRVLDAIQNVTMVPDQLTQSFMTLALQTQTQTLVTSLQAVQDEIAALRREFANQTRLQSLAA